MIQGARSLDPTETVAWMHWAFIVNPERGSLVWVNPPNNHARMRGREAGYVRPTMHGKKYVHIKKDRLAIKRGWLIFLWCHGHWPTHCLDHIDGNSLNDRADNLREATITENAWNRKRGARKEPLPMGVRKMGKHYQARIAPNKTQVHLGTFATAEEAQRVYLAKRKEFYGRFA